MMQVLYYEVKQDKRHRSLCKLMETIVSKGLKILFIVNDASYSYWDALLWTYEQLSFLPHVANASNNAANTPVVISNSLQQAANNAEVIVFADFDDFTCVSIDEVKNFGFNRIVLMGEKWPDDVDLNDVMVTKYRLNPESKWENF